MSTRIGRFALQTGAMSYAELEEGSAWLLDGAPWLLGRRTGERLDGIDDQGRGNPAAQLLAPVAPSKIVCIGRNYRAHAAELGNPMPSEPLLFLKPPSTLVGPGGVIELPPPDLSSRIEHEVELGVVIGSRIRNVDEATAAEAIYGYTVVGDITARDLQRSDKTWTRGKGFDTFCPVGPVVAAGIDTAKLAIRCTVSDELRQNGTTADMHFRPPALLAYISRVMTLEPGDLVATGTPAGVGPLVDGDRLTMEIEGLGTLHLTVAMPQT
ncbi:MAG: 2-hydroxyhepta-2,4-diene-1,7-dioate isomerase [Deltaproteobacteria bacterium]|nr:MAG: 2-hydroxyhepta-2,4-diene-1,7-dioate isomerase [Deltaproteobacteria bacterium]